MSEKTLKDRAKQALSLMDLTSLNDNDNNEVIRDLCDKASTAFGQTAAVCVYAPFVKVAKEALNNNGVKVATVANFPHGGEDIASVEAEIQSQLADGADEIDVVLPYKAFIAGDEKIAAELVARSKAVCGSTTLKVIIETGELKTPENIRRASEIAIDNGADFIKTSTGKVPVNATLESAEIMLNAIKASGKDVGFKAAGGVRTAEEAKAYLEQAENIMGADWVRPERFRFGASGLLGSLLATLNDETPAQNTAAY